MTREEAIHELGEWLEQMIQHGVPNHSAKRKALVTAIALLSAEDMAIEALSARPTGEWIPCSERLPERTDKYLVTVENGNVYAGTFSTFDNKFTCKAVAWMELPEPYKDNND